MITILNTAILTCFGSYCYRPIGVETARELLRDGFESAVGHAATAAILTDLLGVEVPVRRVEYRQGPGARALVFKLRGRVPEGKVLSRAEVEAVGYDLGLLIRETVDDWELDSPEDYPSSED